MRREGIAVDGLDAVQYATVLPANIDINSSE